VALGEQLRRLFVFIHDLLQQQLALVRLGAVPREGAGRGAGW
jgi:hypothetical protein